MRAELLAAIESGDHEALERQLREHPELARSRDHSGASAIQVAVYHGQPEMARRLAAVAGGLDPFEAAALGERERVAAALAADAEIINLRSADGFPILGLAAFFGHVEIVALLLEHGADPDSAAQNALRVRPLNSALACADAQRALSLARLLLAAGADANPPQAGGWTPLHQAASRGDRALVTLLLAHGADREAQSDGGRSPGDMAREHGHQALAQELDQQPEP